MYLSEYSHYRDLHKPAKHMYPYMDFDIEVLLCLRRYYIYFRNSLDAIFIGLESRRAWKRHLDKKHITPWDTQFNSTQQRCEIWERHTIWPLEKCTYLYRILQYTHTITYSRWNSFLLLYFCDRGIFDL